MNLKFRGATTKLEKRCSNRTVPLTLVLDNICVSGTGIYEIRIWLFVVGVQMLVCVPAGIDSDYKRGVYAHIDVLHSHKIKGALRDGTNI